VTSAIRTRPRRETSGVAALRLISGVVALGQSSSDPEKLARDAKDTHGVTVRVLALLLLAGFGSVSCLQIGTGDSADAAPPPPQMGDASDVVPRGLDCVVEPVSGTSLCTRISLCPGVAIDHDAFPNCGFRASSGSLEVDCLCGDFLCPIGTAIRCDQVPRLLAGQSEGLVCTQVSEGRCASLSPSASRDSGSCDRSCLSTCGGDPGCTVLCGC